MIRALSLISFFLLAFPSLLPQRVAASVPSNQHTAHSFTAAFYASFLNAAAKSDPHGLFNINMESAIPAIYRHGVPGEYYYTTRSSEENLPLSYLSVLSAMRLCNWLESKQKNDIDSSELSTEKGVYEIEGDAISFFNEESTYFLLDEEEKKLDPLTPQNRDLLLTLNGPNFFIGTSAPYPSSVETEKLSLRQEKNPTEKKHPIERKAAKAITSYCCLVGGFVTGISLGASLSNCLGISIATSVPLIAGCGALGIIVGIIATDIIWSALNAWLGPPS